MIQLDLGTQLVLLGVRIPTENITNCKKLIWRHKAELFEDSLAGAGDPQGMATLCLEIQG